MGPIRRALIVGVSLAFLGFPSLGVHANLVTDPGFESGGAGWTFVGNAGPDNHDSTHSGQWAGFVNAQGPTLAGTISQAISTKPGDEYSITLWASQNAFVATGAELIISFGGTTLFDQINPAFPINPFPSVPGPDPSAYTELSFTALASTALSTFAYHGQNLSSGTYFLDDVSINDLSSVTVPEPGTLELLGAALCVSALCYSIATAFGGRKWFPLAGSLNEG